jgi:hypothetical protein
MNTTDDELGLLEKTTRRGSKGHGIKYWHAHMRLRCRKGAGRDTLVLRSSEVELFVLCNQLACSTWMEAAFTPAKVGAHMEVVNDALRSVRTRERSSKVSTIRYSHSAAM